MIFFKPKINFKIKELDECCKDCFNRLVYSNNKYEVNCIKHFLNLKNNFSFDNIKEKLKEYYLNLKVAEEQLNLFKSYWQENGDKFLNKLFKFFNIIPNGDIAVNCFLDVLPVPYIDLYNRRLTLSLTNSFEINVKYGLSFLVKIFLLKILNETSSKNLNFVYNKDSVFWIMADLVTDCIFFYEFNEFATNVAYKYYYNLKINNEGVINFLRANYKKMDLNSFISFVTNFVCENISCFTKFSNRY